MLNLKCGAARVLRAVANRLDPEPPHMEAALRLAGWTWNAPLGTYTFTSHANGTLTRVTWHDFTVGGDA